MSRGEISVPGHTLDSCSSLYMHRTRLWPGDMSQPYFLNQGHFRHSIFHGFWWAAHVQSCPAKKFSTKILLYQNQSNANAYIHLYGASGWRHPPRKNWSNFGSGCHAVPCSTPRDGHMVRTLWSRQYSTPNLGTPFTFQHSDLWSQKTWWESYGTISYRQKLYLPAMVMCLQGVDPTFTNSIYLLRYPVKSAGSLNCVPLPVMYNLIGTLGCRSPEDLGVNSDQWDQEDKAKRAPVSKFNGSSHAISPSAVSEYYSSTHIAHQEGMPQGMQTSLIYHSWNTGNDYQ